MSAPRDHGGGVDAARAQWGGQPEDWVDLSTGINPVPYPVGPISVRAWQALPDSDAQQALIAAARQFWDVPEGADIVAAPGASAVIARIPTLAHRGAVTIPTPTYNEHAAAFEAQGWTRDAGGDAMVVVHPNNPDGRLWQPHEVAAPLRVIDESFCDITPAQTLVAQAAVPGTLVLKSFGKFWGLAGLRLGFAIGDPSLIAALREALGPWPVPGPALEIGTRALRDETWAVQTRARLAGDAARLDDIMQAKGAQVVGGTDLFRLYDVGDAAAWQARLARGHVWSRIFPYSHSWLRLGLPAPEQWAQLEAAL